MISALGSCIKNEPLNTEADITKCILPEGVAKSDPKITDDNVLAFIVPGTVDITAVAPEFEVTPGATIAPASGTRRDFTEAQKYTVTSQDGQWSKTYTVTITEAEMNTKYDFENWEIVNEKYAVPYEIMGASEEGDVVEDSQIQYIWSSGNAGYALTGGGGKPDKFPTCYTEGAFSGQYAAKLVTRATGTFGIALKMPIAAGNLFIGSFDGMSATKDPMKATQFGLPFGKKPLRLTGHYHYLSGGNITDEFNKPVVPAKRDSCQIYAVLYETDDEVKCLYGDNVLTSPNLVAVALLDSPTESDNWQAFDVEFRYLKPFDEQKRQSYKYNLAVVFSASRDGARFRGAVGSTLWIDEVEVVCEEPVVNP